MAIKIRNGFTLVELAIVIVIIGLLVGGVLQGKELIEQAKQRKIVANIESYKGAVHTYKAKYNDLPGDSNKHAVFFPSAGITEGDANGTYNLESEPFEFWRALSLSKIIKGTYSGYLGTEIINQDSIPNDSTGVSILYRCLNNTYFPSALYTRKFCGFWVASIKSFTLSSAGYAVLTPVEAKIFDAKYDDGFASTGKILGARYTGVTAGICTDNNSYGSASANYLDNQNLECTLVFEHAF